MGPGGSRHEIQATDLHIRNAPVWALNEVCSKSNEPHDLTINLDVSIATIKKSMDSWATRGCKREESMWRIMQQFMGRRECW